MLSYRNVRFSLTGHDGGSLVHVHVRLGHANGSDKRIVQRRSVQLYDRYVVGVRRVIVVRMRSDVRHSVVDVLRLVVLGEIVLAESDDEILFSVSEKDVYTILDCQLQLSKNITTLNYFKMYQTKLTNSVENIIA